MDAYVVIMHDLLIDPHPVAEVYVQKNRLK